MTDLAALTARLRTAGCVFAEDEARLLAANTSDADHLEALVVRRVAGEPLEHLLGWADFAGLRVAVDPGVFVPRQRTGFLVDRAVALAGAHRRPVVVDLCCGSGAIGLAIAHRLAEVELVAADLDPAAVANAARNIAPVGGRAFQGDLFAALPVDLRARIDVLAVNAPYVPTAQLAAMPGEARVHEGPMALDGGGDGLDLHRRVAAGAPAWLAADGALVIETASAQAPAAIEMMGAVGLAAAAVTCPERFATVVIGRSSPAPPPYAEPGRQR